MNKIANALPPVPDFVAMEEARLKHWYQSGVVKEYLEKNKNSKKKFRFLDGPMTANNPMGVHHAHGRTLKDFFQRVYNARGYRQRFQNGFDCQGLWLEVEEEKALGFNSKRDIEKFGLAKFSLACRARVNKFSAVQTEQSKRLGMFMDWDHSYYTMSERNNLHIWHFLKACDNRGLIYRGTDAMPWCPRCGTAISQHELSDGGYRVVKHNSVFFKLPVVGEDFSLLVWTTTPWTILANVAVAVNTKFQYLLVKDGQGNNLVVVDSQNNELLNAVLGEHQLIKKISGEKLVGLTYTAPYDNLAAVTKVSSATAQTFHRVIKANELVGDDEGTGLVHIAPGAGREDFLLGKKNKLGVIAPLDESGVYLKGFGKYSGRHVNEVKDEIIKDLKEGRYWYADREIEHSYPHCWRCKTELVFRVTDEWFIKTASLKPDLRKATNSVRWVPEYARKRMLDWIENMGDWPISRKRYWGLSLPFYVRKDGSFLVVGSKKELKKMAVDPSKVDSLPSLHRPWIDKIKLKDPKTGEILTRIDDVGDCWLDAGIVPFSTVDYLTNKALWREWFPFDFITEYVAQVKLWFYSTLFMSVVLEGRAPWKSVLATGFIVDGKGEVMHKSKGNSIWFDDAVKKMGADVCRFIYLRKNLSGYIRFGYEIGDAVRKSFFLILWNVYRYYMTYQAGVRRLKGKSTHVLDRWILARLEETQLSVDRDIAGWQTPTAAQALEHLVTDLSTWYVRRSRERVSRGELVEFVTTLELVLTRLSILLAPFIPFLADEIYTGVTGKRSVHLADWPKRVKPDEIDTKLLADMATVRQLAELIHSHRQRAGIKLRQPLAEVSVWITGSTKLDEELVAVLLGEVNIKKCRQNLGAAKLKVLLDTKLTSELKLEGQTRDIIRQIQSLRKKAGCRLDQKITVSLPDWPQSKKRLIEKKTLSKLLKGERLEIVK